jgi:hypothetical protein
MRACTVGGKYFAYLATQVFLLEFASEQVYVVVVTVYTVGQYV